MSGIDQMIRSAIASTTERGRREPAVQSRPQVSLLPTEIRGVADVRRVRAGMVAAVALALAAATGGVLVASAAASDADARQVAAQSRLAASAAQLSKFSDVRDLQQRIALRQAAVRVGSSTSIDWQRTTRLVLASMPSGYSVQTVAVTSATPYADYAQGTSPLEKTRAATIAVNVTTPTTQTLPDWLRELKSLPAYADLAYSVGQAQSGYTVQVTVHLTTAAYSTPLKGK